MSKKKQLLDGRSYLLHETEPGLVLVEKLLHPEDAGQDVLEESHWIVNGKCDCEGYKFRAACKHEAMAASTFRMKTPIKQTRAQAIGEAFMAKLRSDPRPLKRSMMVGPAIYGKDPVDLIDVLVGYVEFDEIAALAKPFVVLYGEFEGALIRAFLTTDSDFDQVLSDIRLSTNVKLGEGEADLQRSSTLFGSESLTKEELTRDSRKSPS